MSGYMYQLKTTAKVGEYVAVAGPWDGYGVVLKEPDEDGYCLIRGVGFKKPEAADIIYTTWDK